MLCHEQFNTREGLLFEDYGAPHGKPDAPVLLYLPGVQGDWTPLWGIAPLFRHRYRLIATAYPRQCGWSLEDHARAAQRLLDDLGIQSAHVLGESFGSIVGQMLALLEPARVTSLVMAGGFCQPPTPWGAMLASRLFRKVSPKVLDSMVRWYVRLNAGQRLRVDRRMYAQAFLAVRSRRGWHACANRMKIIYSTDLRTRLGELKVPMAYMGGERDLVVPVRREVSSFQKLLRPECGFRYKLYANKPHPILPSHPHECAAFIAEWVRDVENGRLRAAPANAPAESCTRMGARLHAQAKA